ncbi:uncharacterized protein BDZ99DRAFT_474422 [Mytilinidion resinicola]|uniref:Uncharacterized protein n=1 Tax=Mytilinidion resinicola TaxID=574789 RepID=A0A6A6YTG4_9PEZI|nr:uncharacterized protein BDZ99DRAFT_474422 [Mytilinidion resinicola]KAF2812212.1 hypothetical protein BDZ99DRAFT_474422 [Mytilinidion resinicola]
MKLSPSPRRVMRSRSLTACHQSQAERDLFFFDDPGKLSRSMKKVHIQLEIVQYERHCVPKNKFQKLGAVPCPRHHGMKKEKGFEGVGCHAGHKKGGTPDHQNQPNPKKSGHFIDILSQHN